MMKKLSMVVLMVMSLALFGCVDRVEVPPAHVGKVSGPNGYEDKIIPTSKFEMNRWCWYLCDKLVLLEVGDKKYPVTTEIFLPKDKIPLTFNLDMTLSVNPEKYNFIYSKQSAQAFPGSKITSRIPLHVVFSTYVQNLATTKVREIVSQYTVAEISSSQEKLNQILSQELGELIAKNTPFLPRFIGIRDIQYPSVIINAQTNAAERREAIAKEAANLEVSKVRLEKELQEAQLQRKIEVERAEAEAEVNLILGGSLTPEYMAYKSLEVASKMAGSDNKVFLPVDMLSTIGGQLQLQPEGKK